MDSHAVSPILLFLSLTLSSFIKISVMLSQ
jgi:hypothetical protein